MRSILERKVNFISILLAILIAIGATLTSFSYFFGLVLIMIMMLAVILLLVTKKIGLTAFLIYSYLAFLAFNVEYPLIFIGDYGFSNEHPGGLRAAIVVNHFFILITSIFLIGILKKEKYEIPLNIEITLWAILIFIGSISLFFADNHYAVFYPLIRNISILLFLVVFSNFKLDYLWDSFKKSLIYFLIPFQFFIGLYQYIFVEPLGLRFLGESNNPFRSTIVVAESQHGMSGTFGHPGIFGLFFIMIMSFILNDLLNKNKEATKRERTFTFISFVMGVSLILMTDSRASIALFAFISLILIVLNLYINKKMKKGLFKILMISASLVMIITTVLALRAEELIERFLGSDLLYQVSYRGGLNEISLDILTQHVGTFLFGVGLNNYTDVVQKMGSGFAYSHPVHNFYLLLTAEGGISQGLIYSGLIAIIIIKMGIVIKKSKDLQLIRKAIVVLTSILALALYNFTGWAAYHNQNYYLFAFLLVLSILITRNYRAERKRKCRNS